MYKSAEPPIEAGAFLRGVKALFLVRQLVVRRRQIVLIKDLSLVLFTQRTVVSGFIRAALLYTLCEIDVKDVPVVITILLWVVFSALMAEFAEKIGL